jgi:hypothetical protein
LINRSALAKTTATTAAKSTTAAEAAAATKTAAFTATAVATAASAAFTAASSTGTASTWTATAATTWATSQRLLDGFVRQQAFPLGFLAGQLARATNSFSLFTGLLFRRLLKIVAQLHFAEDAFALKLLLERLQRLINVIVADENLHV